MRDTTLKILFGALLMCGGAEVVLSSEKTERRAKNVAKHMTFFSKDHKNEKEHHEESTVSEE